MDFLQGQFARDANLTKEKKIRYKHIHPFFFATNNKENKNKKKTVRKELPFPSPASTCANTSMQIPPGERERGAEIANYSFRFEKEAAVSRRERCCLGRRCPPYLVPVRAHSSTYFTRQITCSWTGIAGLMSREHGTTTTSLANTTSTLVKRWIR